MDRSVPRMYPGFTCFLNSATPSLAVPVIRTHMLNLISGVMKIDVENEPGVALILKNKVTNLRMCLAYIGLVLSALGLISHLIAFKL